MLELNEPLEPPPEPIRAAEPPPRAPDRQPEATLGDLEVFSSRPSAPPKPAYTPAPAPDEPLVGSYAAESTASHFGALARSIAMPKEGRSLEDVVREMLKPMLRDWLDQNLPGIVEARVQAEVERISRRHDY